MRSAHVAPLVTCTVTVGRETHTGFALAFCRNGSHSPWPISHRHGATVTPAPTECTLKLSDFDRMRE